MKIQNISSARLCLLASMIVVLGMWLMIVKALYFPNSLNGFIESIKYDFENRFSLTFSIFVNPLILAIVFGISFVKTRIDRERWMFYLVPLVVVLIFSISNYFIVGSPGMTVFSIPFLIWPFVFGFRQKVNLHSVSKKR